MTSPIETLAAAGDEAVQQRLYEIERALKLDPDHAYRRQLRREYLNLTDKEFGHVTESA